MAQLPDIEVHLRMDTTEFDKAIKHLRDELETLPVANLEVHFHMADYASIAAGVRDELLRLKRSTGPLGLT